MEKSNIDLRTEARAHRLQRRADFLTRFRMKHSEKLGLAIGATERGWLTFAAGCVMAWTDLQDGRDAKKAQKLLGIQSALTDGATKDPEADKEFRRSLLDGIVMRGIREGDIKTVAAVAVKNNVDAWRDGRMAENRERAAEHGGISLGAIQINRAKTVLEMGGMLLHISPLANNDRVRDLSLGLMGLGTGLGIAGEHQYRQQVDDAIADQTD